MDSLAPWLLGQEGDSTPEVKEEPKETEKVANLVDELRSYIKGRKNG